MLIYICLKVMGWTNDKCMGAITWALTSSQGRCRLPPAAAHQNGRLHITYCIIQTSSAHTSLVVAARFNLDEGQFSIQKVLPWRIARARPKSSSIANVCGHTCVQFLQPMQVSSLTNTCGSTNMPQLKIKHARCFRYQAEQHTMQCISLARGNLLGYHSTRCAPGCARRMCHERD